MAKSKASKPSRSQGVGVGSKGRNGLLRVGQREPSGKAGRHAHAPARSPRVPKGAVRSRQGVSPSRGRGLLRRPARQRADQSTWGRDGTPDKAYADGSHKGLWHFNDELKRQRLAAKPPSKAKPGKKPTKKPPVKKPPVRSPSAPPQAVHIRRNSSLVLEVPKYTRPEQVRSPSRVREKQKDPRQVQCHSRPKDNRPKGGGGGPRKFIPWGCK